jgi:hypothetical protein
MAGRGRVSIESATRIETYGEKMTAPKGNQFAKGNKGGRPSKYKPEFAEIAKRLCAKCAFTDAQLADWFEVSVRTINEWKLKHAEFGEALKLGKAETDDLVERGTVAGITGYYVTEDEMDRFGNIKQLRKWIPGNAHAGIKWLKARRPDQYRERKPDKHILPMDDAFLRFLDQMDEEANKKQSNKRALPDPIKARSDEFSHPTRARSEAVHAALTETESCANRQQGRNSDADI